MKLKNSLVIILTIIFLSGCASKIMQGFVGKDIRQVVLDYGTPINAMDMGNGVRAFQWKMTNYTHTTPTYINSSSSGSAYGSSYTSGQGSVYGSNYNYNSRTNYNMNAYINTNTVITHSQTYDLTCLYTLFARWDKGRKGWIVTSFKKPNLMCE